MITLQQTLQTTAISSVLFAGMPIDNALHNLPQYNKPSINIEQLENFDPYTILSSQPFNPKEKLQIVSDFASSLLANMEDSPIEFAQALEDHFWDLI